MIRVEAIETILVDVPTIRPHALAMATMQHQTLCLVRLVCSDGITGLGEATTIGGLAYSDESPEGMKLAIDRYLAPLVVGADASRPAMIMARIEAGVVGNRFARCAIETALLDAQGQRLGMPLSELLGGRRRDRLPVVWTLASGDSGRDIAEAEAMLEARRHNIFKLKIGRRAPEADIAHVAAICRALDGRARIRVDLNMAWSEDDARLGLARLADVGCELAEQPIARDNREGLARLRAGARLRIMADEALNGPADALALARLGAADVFSVKIETSGGLAAARAVAAIGAAAGIGLYGGTMLEAGVGTAASAHLFATFPRLDHGTELFGPLLLVHDILENPLVYRDFQLEVPPGPGLGVRLDADRIAAFRRDAPKRTGLQVNRSKGVR